MNINMTLVLQMVVFGLFWWFSKKYVWVPIMQALDERKKGIADSLSAAERAKTDQEDAQKNADKFITEAKDQAADIVAKAEKRGSTVVEEAKYSAKAEGSRIVTAAQAEVDQQVNRAREALRGEVAALAAAGASKILGKEIDAKSHAKLIDELVSEIKVG
ncbi:MAG: F0F1 ATP synthase subunit B [Arenicellaceae bacterium]|nr:F0F1 ATP synthase subunit B [Arenicellaceae bacterium]